MATGNTQPILPAGPVPIEPLRQEYVRLRRNSCKRGLHQNCKHCTEHLGVPVPRKGHRCLKPRNRNQIPHTYHRTRLSRPSF